MLERIMRVLRRKSEPEVEEEEIVEEEPVVEEKKVEDIKIEDVFDPWKSFTTLCKELGYDYREVIDKAAWYYIEDSGFATVYDPIAQTKELAEAISTIENAFEKLNEPTSLKKLRQYKEAIKELAEFKQAVRELRQGKLTTYEMIAVVRDLLNKFG